MTWPSLGSRASVLIVGAGPVGLVAAITLREHGVSVRIVDELAIEDKRMYPVVVHARTLKVLQSLRVVAPIEWRGRGVTHLAIYADRERRAVLDLPAADEMSPGAMTLPQDVLRRALVNRLSELGTQVEWQTRLVALEQRGAHVRSSLIRRERVEAAGSALWPDRLDAETATTESEFLIGADGVRSSVREKLGISWISQGYAQAFAFYDVPDSATGTEACLVIHETQGNSVYPQHFDMSRFTFQLGVGMTHVPGITQFRQLLSSRMPWYAGEAQRVEWSGSAEFHPALAERFGEGRIWLAGDAAHSTGPLGGQSFNVGIHEAYDLARRITEHMRGVSAAPLGPGYAQQRQLEWQVLFGLSPSRPNVAKSSDWVKRNLQLLLQSLPAGGDDLDDLLDQLHVRAA